MSSGPDAPTAQLLELCMSTQWNPPEMAVRQCVSEGGNVLYRSASLHDGIFATLVSRGSVAAVLACLETTKAMDFNTLGDGSRTALHWICERSTSDDAAVAITTAIVQRLQRKIPGDSVNWNLVDWEKESFFTRASRNQQLSLLWPLVQEVYCTAPSAVLPIPLQGEIWSWDWEALQKAGQGQYFQLVPYEIPESMKHWRNKVIPPGHVHVIEASRGSGLLYRLTLREEPDPAEVLSYVQLPAPEAADVLFYHPDLNIPVLSTFLQNGHLECVKACLRTPQRPLDLTQRDFSGGTPLKYLCFPRPEHCGAALELLLDRILKEGVFADLRSEPDSGDEDVMINWEDVDAMCGNFCSLAAFCQCLSLVCEVLQRRQLPYFVQHNGPIKLTSEVHSKDWERLSEEDKKRFDTREARKPVVFHLHSQNNISH